MTYLLLLLLSSLFTLGELKWMWRQRGDGVFSSETEVVRKWSSLSPCLKKRLHAPVYLQQTRFYQNTGAGQPVDVLHSHVNSDLLLRGCRKGGSGSPG